MWLWLFRASRYRPVREQTDRRPHWLLSAGGRDCPGRENQLASPLGFMTRAWRCARAGNKGDWRARAGTGRAIPGSCFGSSAHCTSVRRCPAMRSAPIGSRSGPGSWRVSRARRCAPGLGQAGAVPAFWLPRPGLALAGLAGSTVSDYGVKVVGAKKPGPPGQGGGAGLLVERAAVTLGGCTGCGRVYRSTVMAVAGGP